MCLPELYEDIDSRRDVESSALEIFEVFFQFTLAVFIQEVQPAQKILQDTVYDPEKRALVDCLEQLLACQHGS